MQAQFAISKRDSTEAPARWAVKDDSLNLGRPMVIADKFFHFGDRNGLSGNLDFSGVGRRGDPSQVFH